MGATFSDNNIDIFEIIEKIESSKLTVQESIYTQLEYDLTTERVNNNLSSFSTKFINRYCRSVDDKVETISRRIINENLTSNVDDVLIRRYVHDNFTLNYVNFANDIQNIHDNMDGSDDDKNNRN